jgi:hypothetical protein
VRESERKNSDLDAVPFNPRIGSKNRIEMPLSQFSTGDIHLINKKEAS